MSWSTSELRVRLAPWNRLEPSSKIIYWPFQGGTSFVDILCVFSFLCLLSLCGCLFNCALWSPAGKGLPSWLSFVVYNWVCHHPIGILGPGLPWRAIISLWPRWVVGSLPVLFGRCRVIQAGHVSCVLWVSLYSGWPCWGTGLYAVLWCALWVIISLSSITLFKCLLVLIPIVFECTHPSPLWFYSLFRTQFALLYWGRLF